MDSQPSQEVTDLLRQWEELHSSPNYDPIPTLTRLAEIIEAETENFMKKDPDPFDERHPSRTDPSCALGHALKVMFKKDNFMTKLVNDYVRDTYYSRLNISGRDVRKLNIAACRLTLDLMPGLEMSVVFQDNEGLIHRLYSWAEHSVEPLQTYATGLLAAAMEVQDIASLFREQNARLVPLMLQRLHQLRRKCHAEPPPSAGAGGQQPTRHFARFAPALPLHPAPEEGNRKRLRFDGGVEASDEDPGGPPTKQAAVAGPDNGIKRNSTDNFSKTATNDKAAVSNDSIINSNAASPLAEGMMSPPRGPPLPQTPAKPPPDSASNSSWAEMETYVIGNIQIHPPTDATRQMLILRYLTPMGEYQEFLSHVFAENALELILAYVNLRESRDSRLAFEALKYLAALLCHKKFSIEFINMNGLQRFLEVPRPSVAATGVSICMYYLAYCEEAMERVCLLPRHVLADLVSYALWLLECSHDSGRCHATMFFGFSFQFRVILEEFDSQDGLRKLYNVISTLPILSVEDDVRLSEDESCAARQIVRHVCVALKRYLESHLHHKAGALRRQGKPGELQAEQPAYKACKSSPEEIQEQIERLQAAAWTRWAPCDQLLRLGGVTLLLQIIAFSYEWNFNGRAETVRSALDVISACCVAPRAQLTLCERVEMPEDGQTVGTNIVLGAAEGEIVPDAEVQKAALKVLVNCVCAPVHRIGGTTARFSIAGSSKKKTNLKSYEEIIQKVWESVRTNNGIMVLLQLMMVKSPITDADCLRGLACRALAGLARCPTVRQIISNLPLFTTGQIQGLMRDPILQEKRQEHVMFQKYALELMERVSGKTKPSGAEFETSLYNIHRANVVAQTHITFNDQQLYQLVYQHLLSRGLSGAAEALRCDAALAPVLPAPAPPPPPVYQPVTPQRTRMLSHNRASTSSMECSSTPQPPILNGCLPSEDASCLGTPNSQQIKIRRCPLAPACAERGRSLQKGAGPPPAAGPAPGQPAQARVSLDSIITEYLANQHALCKNPMATCPQFNLFEPHKCPDARRGAPANLAARLPLRQAGMCAPRSRHDVRRVHAHFYPARTLRLPDDDSYFTCCAFHPTQQLILAGTSAGDLKLYNLSTGQEEGTYQLHDSYIYHMQANRQGSLLLASSSTWRRPLSGMWNMRHYTSELSLNDEEYVEFSKLAEERIIGTRREVARVYDVNTGKLLRTLTPALSNQYSKNRATFNPTDELVLSDGVLWDMKGGKEIHKFDKLNQSLSGVFHPNGLEIISNTEVWDLRTFHLLRTVPTLNKSEITFSPLGGVMYSLFVEQDQDQDSCQYESSFKTLDSYDYSSIATIDVKRNIWALGVAGWGGQIALAENISEYETIQESLLKVYEVGRRRDQDDDAEEDEEEEVGNSDNEGSDSGSDNEGSGLFEDDALADLVDADASSDESGADANNDGNSDDNSTTSYDSADEDDVDRNWVPPVPRQRSFRNRLQRRRSRRRRNEPPEVQPDDNDNDEANDNDNDEAEANDNDDEANDNDAEDEPNNDEPSNEEAQSENDNEVNNEESSERC